MDLAAVRLFVDDLPAARAFYQDTLELRASGGDNESGYVSFKSAGIDLVIESVPGDAPADDRALVGRFAGVSFSVPDIRKAYATLRGKGVLFTGTPEPQAWGGSLATFKDPAGNELQIVQY